MEQQDSSGAYPVVDGDVRRSYETSPEYLYNVLRYVVEIGASLRQQMDTDTLLKRIAATTCKALSFRYIAIYLADGHGFFRIAAASGVTPGAVDYLQKHPLPEGVIAQIVNERYRLSNSYFLPAEDPIWENEEFSSYFVVVNSDADTLIPVSRSTFTPTNSQEWSPEDLMLVPLMNGKNQLLGFLNPDAPLHGLRPTRETTSLFELFANQAAAVIEGARLYEELRGAGVPSKGIGDYRAHMMHPVQYHSLFIAYSSKDEILARRLHADLLANGVRCWFAPEDMKIGDEIRSRIDAAIHLQDKLLLLLSEHSIASTWVKSEVEAAFEKEGRQQREVLFPVRLDDTVMQTSQVWAATLRRTRHIGDFTAWIDPLMYQTAFERLLCDLKADV